MILSVSRRTDIPAYYGKWFMNRLRTGCVMIRNPMNYHQISQLELRPELVDCIVFWTKDAAPMLPYLDEIGQQYMFYFQYTLNGYGEDVETNVPALSQKLATIKALREKLGIDRVIWRYDPIMLSEKYDMAWHKRTFAALCEELAGSTKICVLSFLDLYDKIKSNMRHLAARTCTTAEMNELAGYMSDVAGKHQIRLQTCAEEIDLAKYGIAHGSCIDGKLIEKLTGWQLAGKDDKQRAACRCLECIDIGQYNTCRHGCRYCYANFNPKSVETFSRQHNDESPLLVGEVGTSDKITLRKNVKSLKVRRLEEAQLALF